MALAAKASPLRSRRRRSGTRRARPDDLPAAILMPPLSRSRGSTGCVHAAAVVPYSAAESELTIGALLRENEMAIVSQHQTVATVFTTLTLTEGEETSLMNCGESTESNLRQEETLKKSVAEAFCDGVALRDEDWALAPGSLPKRDVNYANASQRVHRPGWLQHDGPALKEMRLSSCDGI